MLCGVCLIRQPVLPAATEHDVLFAVRDLACHPVIEIANVQPFFKPCKLALQRNSAGNWEVDGSTCKKGGWELYVKAVVAECLSTYFTRGDQPKGLQCMVSGNVPPGSGLSVG